MAWLLVIVSIAGIAMLFVLNGCPIAAASEPGSDVIALPAPAHDGGMSVEKALLQRRSVREYSGSPVSLTDVSQLLWAAQGVTGTGGLRTAPSAGALYPLEAYLVAGNVEGLSPGVYKYRPRDHSLGLIIAGDRRSELYEAALRQPSVKGCALAIVIAGVYERTTGKYNARLRDEMTGSEYAAGVKYVHMEAGHVSQNIYLQSISLNLGTVAIGAFSDGDVKIAAGMQEDERPMYVMPVGRA